MNYLQVKWLKELSLSRDVNIKFVPFIWLGPKIKECNLISAHHIIITASYSLTSISLCNQHFHFHGAQNIKKEAKIEESA